MQGQGFPIRDFLYDAGHTKLIIRFEHGEERLYVGVPPALHRELCEAASISSFFGERIQGAYPYNVLSG